jgi:hypothetical protein
LPFLVPSEIVPFEFQGALNTFWQFQEGLRKFSICLERFEPKILTFFENFEPEEISGLFLASAENSEVLKTFLRVSRRFLVCEGKFFVPSRTVTPAFKVI